MKGKRKTLLCGTFLIVCTIFFFFGLRSAQENSVGATAIGTVNVSGYLNVRTGPGTSYAIVKSGGTGVILSNGAKITITGKNGNWYHVKFTQNSKTVKGYVSADYVKVQTGSVRTKVYGNVSAKTLKVRQAASSSAAVLKSDSKEVSLKKGEKVRVLSESIVKNQKWYKISVSFRSKTCKGYVLSKNVTLQCEKGLPGVIKSSAAVTVLKDAGKTTVVTVKNQKVRIKNGKQLTILGEKVASGIKYLSVKVSYNGSSVKGYVADEVGFLQIVTEEKAAASGNPTY